MSAMAASAWARWLLRVHRLLQKASGGRAGLHVYLLCAQPVGVPPGGPAKADPHTRIVTVAPADPLVSAFPRPAEVVRQRFESGARCYAALVKQEFAGHVWLATGHYDEDEVRCRYEMPEAPPCVWDFDVYVEPRYRLTRVMSRLWQGVNRELAEQGVQWSFSRISLFSKKSVSSHERLGARRVGVVAFLVLWRLQLTLQSGPPRVHIGTGRRSVPTFALRSPLQ